MTQKQKSIRPLVEVNSDGELTMEAARRIIAIDEKDVHINELHIHMRAKRVLSNKPDILEDEQAISEDLLDSKTFTIDRNWIKLRKEVAEKTGLSEYSATVELVTFLVKSIRDGKDMNTFAALDEVAFAFSSKRAKSKLLLSNAVEVMRDSGFADLPCVRMRACVLKAEHTKSNHKFTAFIEGLRAKEVYAIKELKNIENRDVRYPDRYIMKDILRWLAHPDQIRRYKLTSKSLVSEFCKNNGFHNVTKFELYRYLNLI